MSDEPNETLGLIILYICFIFPFLLLLYLVHLAYISPECWVMVGKNPFHGHSRPPGALPQLWVPTPQDAPVLRLKLWGSVVAGAEQPRSGLPGEWP